MMQRLRPLFSLVLVLVTVFLVSCGGPTKVAAPPTYSQAQLERIQDYSTSILEKHEGFQDLVPFLQTLDAQRIQAVTNGPLGQMLQDMYNLNRNLLVKDQKPAQEKTRDLFDHLVAMKEAVDLGNKTLAQKNYGAAVKDFEEYMALLPKNS